MISGIELELGYWSMSQSFTGQDLRIGLFRVWMVLCGIWFLNIGHNVYKQAGYCSRETGLSTGHCLLEYLSRNVFMHLTTLLVPPMLLLLAGSLLVMLASWSFRRR